MNTILEYIKAIIAFCVMVFLATLPIAGLWCIIIKEALHLHERWFPIVVAGLLMSPGAVIGGLMLGSAAGNFFLRYWGPRE